MVKARTLKSCLQNQTSLEYIENNRQRTAGKLVKPGETVFRRIKSLLRSPSIALDKVTSSAYSRSPPIGRPCAIRVVLDSGGLQQARDIHGCRQERIKGMSSFLQLEDCINRLLSAEIKLGEIIEYDRA